MMFWSSSRIGQRRAEEHQPRDGEQEVHHRVQVAKPLRQPQTRAEHRVVGAEDLQHAARPAHALADMQRQPLGRQARGERHLQIAGAPALALQPQRGVRVLGHGFDGEAADALDRRAADHRAGAAEERRVPEIVAVLHQRVEHVAFAGHSGSGGEVSLERIGRIEMMRRLDQRHALVAHQPAHRHLQEGARRHVVAVEDRDELAVGVAHRVIEVAGLGVVVVGADDVAGTAGFGEVAELAAPAVVQDVDAQLVAADSRSPARPAPSRAPPTAIHCRSGCRRRRWASSSTVVGQRFRLAFQRPDGLDVAQHHHRDGVAVPPAPGCRPADLAARRVNSSVSETRQTM